MKKVLFISKFVLPILIAVFLLQVVNVPDSQAAPPAWGGSNYHTVRYGETLFSIGRLYGVNPYAIAEANGLSNPDWIYAGQVLYIPSGGGYGNNYGREYRQPYYSPGYGAPGYGGCGGNSCYRQGNSVYGYDYTGYYYYNTHPQYRRYSYTCGYYYNCY